MTQTRQMTFRWAAFATLVLCCTAAPLSAQNRPLRVSAVRNMTFGLMLPGVPQQVSRIDPTRSGEFALTGTRLTEVNLTFTLPGVLVGPGGEALNLSFGAADAGYSASENIANQIAFDPRMGFTAQLSNNGRGSVYIGGTALPSAGQSAGAYTASIILTVALVGL